MRILLTGASGQLGRQIRANNTHHDITAVSHQELDVSVLDDVRAVVASAKPELVLNAAAFNDVDAAESNPDAAIRGNALGPRNLALAAQDIGAAIVHVSTDYVFDGGQSTPYHEYDRPAPLSNYGRSKLAGEVAVRDLTPRHYVVRTSWVYELHGNNFPNTLRRLATQQPELRIVNDVKGSPTSARHLAQSILTLIDTGAYGTYHLSGAGSGASWFEIASHLFKELGLSPKLTPVRAVDFPRPAPRPRYSVLRTIQQPQILLPPWQDGIAEFAREIKSKAGDTAQ